MRLVRGAVGNHDDISGCHEDLLSRLAVACLGLRCLCLPRGVVPRCRQSSTPRHTLGARTTSSRSISARAACSSASMARCVMITSGTGPFQGVVAGIVLDDAGDADSMLAQDRRQRGQHAGTVGDREPQVVSALDLLGPASDGAAGPARPRARARARSDSARPVTTSIRSPTTAEAVGIMPAPRP